MYRKLLLMALLGLSFAACKPTQRRVVTHRPDAGQEQQESHTDEKEPAGQAPAQEDKTPCGELVVTAPQTEPSSAPGTEAADVAQEFSDCLLVVRSVMQNYSSVRPWEKENPSGSKQNAIYMGNGQVLVCGALLRAATYVELSLPDGSRTVTARVVKYDADLGLGLLTVAHEEDASIFTSRKAYPVGTPLHVGDSATVWYLINGTIPAKADLLAESGGEEGRMPCINLKAAQSVTGDNFSGTPIVREGKLVGMTQRYNGDSRVFSCVNAEIIQRFLEEDTVVASAGAPVLGLSFQLLSDPAFRRYLKLEDSQTGLYVNKVEPMGAAAAAGIQEGDVVTAVEGMPVDSLGRCNHPVYGPLGVSCLAHSLKPVGQTLKVTISRAGETKEVEIPLNRDAREKSLVGSDKPGVQPRYVLWGGMLFQVVTNEYLQAIRNRAGGLPVYLLEIDRREKELREAGVTELIALSGTIPTPATLGYEGMGGCLVEKVNGKVIHNLREFEEALDAPTREGIVEFSINRPPYTIYVDTQMAEAANDALRRNSIHTLRHTGGEK